MMDQSPSNDNAPTRNQLVPPPLKTGTMAENIRDIATGLHRDNPQELDDVHRDADTLHDYSVTLADTLCNVWMKNAEEIVYQHIHDDTRPGVDVSEGYAGAWADDAHQHDVREALRELDIEETELIVEMLTEVLETSVSDCQSRVVHRNRTISASFARATYDYIVEISENGAD